MSDLPDHTHDEARLLRSVVEVLTDDVWHTDRLRSPAEETLDALLERMAGTAVEYFGATNCDLWVYDAVRHGFKCGATYPLERPHEVRRKGWTYHIVAACQRPAAGGDELVRFTDIRSPAAFARWRWVRGAGHAPEQWCPGAEGPAELNVHALNAKSTTVVGHGFRIGPEYWGVMWLYSNRPDWQDGPADVARLRAFVGHVATLWVMRRRTGAAQTFRKITDEHERELFGTADGTVYSVALRDRCPALPASFGRLDVAVRRTALGEFGGDFVGWAGGPDALSLIMGDAEGHGIRGALGSLQALTAFATAAAHFRSARELFREVAGALRGDSCEFAVFNVVPHPSGRFVVYYSCGGFRFVVRRADGVVQELPAPDGVAAGAKVFPAPQVAVRWPGEPAGGDWLPGEESLFLEAGDVIVAVTDGITEASNREEGFRVGPAAGELFGMGRVLKAVEGLRRANLSAREVVELIYRRCEEWCGSIAHDDRCVMAIVVRPDDDG